jgi:DNA-binding LacI/PurR family transcriptional regulator
MRRTTIADVAAEAGVGVATVSRVLNASSSVREGTRRRVLEAIVALDYQPSAAARALSTGRTHTIGVVAPFFTRPAVIERLRGVSRTVAEAGYQLILVDGEPAARRRMFRARALHGRIDGLMSISIAPTDEEVRSLRDARVTVVLVDGWHGSLPSIGVDDREGGRMAAEHLLALGHRRIAFLDDCEQDEPRLASSARRREGFEAGLAAAGAPLAPELCRSGGRRAAAELLALADPPTAVFAASDTVAIAAMDAADAAGVPVPDRLSVIGFDDVELATYAGLTTIAQPLEGSGALGAEMLLRAMTGEPVEGRRLPLELVERGSTGPFRRRASCEGNRTHDVKSELRRRRVRT